MNKKDTGTKKILEEEEIEEEKDNKKEGDIEEIDIDKNVDFINASSSGESLVDEEEGSMNNEK